MRNFPSLNPGQRKVCAGCGLTVARRDSHRSRYGEYFCRACQASGVKSTRMGRLRYGSGRALAQFWIGAAIVVGLAVVLWILYALAMHLSDASEFL